MNFSLQTLGKHVESLVRSVTHHSSSDSPEAARPPATPGRISLLTEVDFKWLMAGQGWHVDAARFQNDPDYAKTLLKLALESNCPALRNCANNILEASWIIQP